MRRLRAVLVLAVLCLGAVAQQVAAQGAPALIDDPGRFVDGTRGNTVRALSIESRILGERRRINILLPVSHGSGPSSRSFPVIVVLDGEAYMPQVATASDELVRLGRIPEAIIVGIENTARLRDLTPPGLSVSGSGLHEGGDRFLDFIERELLPAVDRQFRGSAPRLLIGHSSGGILAVYAAATRDVFRSVIAIDAPIELADNWLSRGLLARANRKQGAVDLAYYAARFPWPMAAWEALKRAAPPTWRLRNLKLEGETHESVVMLATYLGLRDTYADYSSLTAASVPADSLLDYYVALGRRYGGTLPPPRRALVAGIQDLTNTANLAGARRMHGTLLSTYGASSESAALEELIAERERAGPPAETVESLLATPFATVAAASRFLGDWEGETWLGEDGMRRPLKLSLRDSSGTLVAVLERPEAPRHLQTQRIEYLVVTSQGLAFGFMNGMQPRAVVVFDATASGEVLEGRTRLRGVFFPEGESPPEPRFVFRKRSDRDPRAVNVPTRSRRTVRVRNS